MSSSYVFAYRELDNAGHRDCVHYIEPDCGTGSKHTCGPCFSAGLEKMCVPVHPSNEIPAYDEIETYLSEDQWERWVEYGIDDDIIATLMSPEAFAFADQIADDEKQVLMDEHGLSYPDVECCLENYPDPAGYFDRGIVGSVFASWEELKEEKAWSWGIDTDDEDAMDEFNTAIDNDEDFMELPDGRIVEFMR